MTPEDAFLSPYADDLFASIAAFGDAKELEMLDVVSGQKEARVAIDSVIDNALCHKHNPGARLALIKGDAGSGKSHVLTTTFKRAASRARDEVYPAILQLTAPVKPEEYEIWLLDAIIRQLSARHFADENNHSPLRRLAGRLLDRLELAEQKKFLHAFEDIDTDDEINLAIELAERISKEAAARLGEAVPIPEFIAVVLLAGFGDASALNFLRHGKVGRRLKELELDEPATAHERIDILNNLALTAQIVGASIALGFDQVENTLRLGSRKLFVHALTQAVRIAESIVNCAIVIVALGVEYDKLAIGRENQPPSSAQPTEDTPPLAVADRDRIEQEEPFAVSLDLGTPQFLRDVIALRLAVLRERAKLPQGADPLDPLPEWFCRRIDEARSVRLALREVAKVRLHARKLFRLPTQSEYEGSSPENTPEPPQETDFDKEWADFLDSGGSTLTKLLDSKKAELLSWWAEEASCEHLNAEPAEVTRAVLDDAQKTPIIEILLKSKGEAIARRRLALCEAPNRNQQLANQIERFLAASDAATPAVLRTNGFPKGRTSQVARPRTTFRP